MSSNIEVSECVNTAKNSSQPKQHAHDIVHTFATAEVINIWFAKENQKKAISKS